MHEGLIFTHTCSARPHSFLFRRVAAAEVTEPGQCLLFMKWRLGYMVFNKLTDDLPSVSSYILSILRVFIRTWIQSRIIASPCFGLAVWSSSLSLRVTHPLRSQGELLTATFSEFICLGLGSGRHEPLQCFVAVCCLLCWELFADRIPCNRVEFSPDQFMWWLEILSLDRVAVVLGSGIFLATPCSVLCLSS